MGGLFTRLQIVLYNRLFHTTLYQAWSATWRCSCKEISTPKFWSLYHCICQGKRAQGAEDLCQKDRVMTTDIKKTEALSSVFSSDMPTLERDDQRAIDVGRRKHHLPRAIDRLQVFALEVISVVRGQRMEATPSRDGIPLRMIKKCMITLLLLLLFWLLLVYSAYLHSGHYPQEQYAFSSLTSTLYRASYSFFCTNIGWHYRQLYFPIIIIIIQLQSVSIAMVISLFVPI